MGAGGTALTGLAGLMARGECPGPTPLGPPKRLSVHGPGEKEKVVTGKAPTLQRVVHAVS